MLVIHGEFQKAQGRVYKMALKVSVRLKPLTHAAPRVCAAGVRHPQADFFSLGVICLPDLERAPERISAKKALKASHH